MYASANRLARKLRGKNYVAVEVPVSDFSDDEDLVSPPKKPAFADATLQFKMDSFEEEPNPRQEVIGSTSSSTQSAIEVVELHSSDEETVPLVKQTLDTPKPTPLKVKLFNSCAKVPVRGTPHSAGLDLFTSESVSIPAHSIARVETSVCVEIPSGHYGQILDRSSNVMNMQIHVVAGVIDSDYRGSIKVCLYNMSSVPVMLPLNFKVAQLVISPYLHCEPRTVSYLSVTQRGSKGFGSTD